MITATPEGVVRCCNGRGLARWHVPTASNERSKIHNQGGAADLVELVLRRRYRAKSITANPSNYPRGHAPNIILARYLTSAWMQPMMPTPKKNSPALLDKLLLGGIQTRSV
eukprot:scaffold33711_cov54-Attheya_sp.AAC.6